VIDKAVVEVGRPQLDSIETARDVRGDGRFTVLYAPTWEGGRPTSTTPRSY
jgi:hypothetical protein